VLRRVVSALYERNVEENLLPHLSLDFIRDHFCLKLKRQCTKPHVFLHSESHMLFFLAEIFWSFFAETFGHQNILVIFLTVVFKLAIAVCFSL